MSFRVLGLGEILWDLLPSGRQMGGAPANFAYHAAALGAIAGVITRVGNDDLGREIVERLHRLRLPTDLVQRDDESPTGTVSVELDAAGVPRFTIHVGVAWDRLEATDVALREVRRADAVCFGSLAQREPAARSAIHVLLGAAPAEAWRIFDINLRQHYYSREIIEGSLQLANVLKLNDAELPVMKEMFRLTGDEREQCGALAHQFGLKVVALTRGPRGSLLWRGGAFSECVPQPVRVVDTVGAGDAFTAMLAIGLLRGLELPAINAAANEVAGLVCSCAGATPVLPRELTAKFGGGFRA